MTHLSASQSPLAVDPVLVQVLEGIEEPVDLLKDLQQALAHA